MSETPVNLTLSLSPKVLQHISSSVYRNSASAIKELASNSFDARAKEFHIRFTIIEKAKATFSLEEVTIEDDGEGIDKDKLTYIFNNIGNSLKSQELEYDSQDSIEQGTNKPYIGRIGIGLFSLAAASSNFILETKCKGGEARRATVNLTNFDQLRTTNDSLDQFNAGYARIELLDQPEEKESYTNIIIKEFKKPFMESIMGAFKSSIAYEMLQHSTTDFEHFLDEVSKHKNLDDAPGFDKFIFDLTSMLQIEYLPSGPFREGVIFQDDAKDKIDKICARLKGYNFKCFLHIDLETESNTKKSLALQLYRNVYLPTKADLLYFGMEALQPHVLAVDDSQEIPNELGDTVNLELELYIYHQKKRINPIDYRGILYRIYDVGIGNYEYQKFRPFSSTVLNFQTSIEIFMNRGFQSCVNIDRESLFEAAYSYRYLKAFLEYTIKGTPYLNEAQEQESKNIYDKDSKTMYDEVLKKKITAIEFENKFDDQLKMKFSTKNEKPLINSLRSFIKHENFGNTDNAITPDSPIFEAARQKFGKDIQGVKIESSSFDTEPKITTNGGILVISVPKKKSREPKIPYSDIVAISELILNTQDKKIFFDFLKKYYK